MNLDNYKLATPPETECKCKECGEDISIMQEGFCDECLIELTKGDEE